MLSLNDRQSHLEAMGVHQWYARTKLAGAQSTPDWFLVESFPPSEALLQSASDSESLPRPIESRESNPVPAMSAMDILKGGGLQAAGNEPVEELSSVKRSAVQGSLTENLPDLPEERALESFSLVLYRTSSGLILSESVSGQSHPSELQLIKNILKSKQGLAQLHLNCQYHQTFNWPVFRSLNLQSKQGNELPALLSNWLLSHCTKDVESILYFGSSFSDIRSFYARLLSESSVAYDLKVFKHSLADLIQFPQRKVDIWAELCSLYGE